MSEKSEKEKMWDAVGSIVVNDFFSIIPVHRAAVQVKEFIKFCDKHSIDENIRLDGMKMLLEAIHSAHLQEFDGNQILKLETSEKYYRSSYVNVERAKRPLDAPLGKMAYNLYTDFRDLRKVKKLSEFESVYSTKIEKYIDTLEELFVKHVTIKDKSLKIGVKDALSSSSLEWVLHNILDFRHNHAIMARTDPAHFFYNKFPPYFEKIKHGIYASIGFLYSYIYDPLFKSDLGNQIAVCQDDSGLSKLIREVRKTNWKQVEDRFGDNLSSFYQFDQTIDPVCFTYLTSNANRTAGLTDTEKIDEFFYFYPFEIIFGRMKMFAGPAAVIRILAGEVWNREEYELNTKIEVVKIKHPIEDGGNNISYGILLRAGGSFHDVSGWLIFRHCCDDLLMGSKAQEVQIDTRINVWRNHINYRECKISLQNLDNHILNRTSSRSYTSIGERAQVYLGEAISNADKISALILELLVAILYPDSTMTVRWAFRNPLLNDYEIDILASTEQDCFVVEVSHRLSTEEGEAEKFIEEFQKKIEGLKQIEEFKECTFHKVFVTRRKHQNDIRMKNVLRLLEQNQIQILPFEEIIENKNLHEKELDRLGKNLSKLEWIRKLRNS